MSALPTPDKKLLALRKRLCDEGLGVYFDGLWQVEVRVERSKRLGSESQRREVLCLVLKMPLLCPGTESFYGSTTDLPSPSHLWTNQKLAGCCQAVKRRHSSGASAVNANLAPISATTKQDNAKPEYQYAGFAYAKAFFNVLAYILCVLFIMFSSLVIYNMVTILQ